jgi:hypothetical protein
MVLAVQSDLECIVIHLTAAYERYESAPPATVEGQWHFATQIKLALDKAQEYYAKLDDSAAYLAAIVLHPKYGWKYVEAAWANNKKWLNAGKKAVESLWVSSYKQQPVSEAISPQKHSSNHEPSMMEAHRLRA